MNLKDLFLSVGVILALVFGAVAYVNSLAPLPTVVEPTDGYGAASGPEQTSTLYFKGGFTSAVVPFTSTTTVACAIQNPLLATTTFSKVGILTEKATTTTTVLGIATTTNANRFATSTAVASLTVAANKQGVGTYIPTTGNDILGPGEWITVGYGAGTTLPTVAQKQSAVCSAVFNVLK